MEGKGRIMKDELRNRDDAGRYGRGGPARRLVRRSRYGEVGSRLVRRGFNEGGCREDGKIGKTPLLCQIKSVPVLGRPCQSKRACRAVAVAVKAGQPMINLAETNAAGQNARQSDRAPVKPRHSQSQSVAVILRKAWEMLNPKTMKCNDLHLISGLAGSKTGQSGCFRPFVQSFPTSQFQPLAFSLQPCPGAPPPVCQSNRGKN